MTNPRQKLHPWQHKPQHEATNTGQNAIGRQVKREKGGRKNPESSQLAEHTMVKTSKRDGEYHHAQDDEQFCHEWVNFKGPQPTRQLTALKVEISRDGAGSSFRIQNSNQLNLEGTNDIVVSCPGHWNKIDDPTGLIPTGQRLAHFIWNKIIRIAVENGDP